MRRAATVTFEREAATLDEWTSTHPFKNRQEPHSDVAGPLRARVGPRIHGKTPRRQHSRTNGTTDAESDRPHRSGRHGRAPADDDRLKHPDFLRLGQARPVRPKKSQKPKN